MVVVIVGTCWGVGKCDDGGDDDIGNDATLIGCGLHGSSGSILFVTDFDGAVKVRDGEQILRYELDSIWRAQHPIFVDYGEVSIIVWTVGSHSFPQIRHKQVGVERSL